MVAGQARALMEHDWDLYAADPSTPERAYEVMRDSVSVWRVSETDTIVVLFVLEARPIPANHASPVSFDPMYVPLNPMIHTHGGYCSVSPWGIERSTCSNERPEANQCRPSIIDQRTQIAEGHAYDFVQCGRSSWVLYLNPRVGE